VYPQCIASTEKESSRAFLKFGLEELYHLLDKFETSLSIERENCVREYMHYKRLVCGSYGESNFASCVKSICEKYHEIMSNVVKLLEVGIIINRHSSENKIPLDRWASPVKRPPVRYKPLDFRNDCPVLLCHLISSISAITIDLSVSGIGFHKN